MLVAVSLNAEEGGRQIVVTYENYNQAETARNFNNWVKMGSDNKMVHRKEQRLSELISYCRQQGWSYCVTYLENAAPDMFSGLLNRLQGRTVSLVERVMRTVNMRINVGKWSIEGALNATKIRLAYYYNGFDPCLERAA